MGDSEQLVEAMARIIDPSSWAVMDSYLEQTKRKYAGQNVGWPADQFKDKESMARARALLPFVQAAVEAERERYKAASELVCEAVVLLDNGRGIPDDARYSLLSEPFGTSGARAMSEGLEELAARVEAAEGPSRELDAAIVAVVQAGMRHPWFIAPPAFTASLDAAMQLVPKGCGFLLTNTHMEKWAQVVGQGKLSDGTLTVGPSFGSAKATTPALALVAAALRARSLVSEKGE